MKYKKIKSAIIIVIVIVLFISGGLMYNLNEYFDIQYDEVSMYTATVESCEILTSNGSEYLNIKPKEYNCDLRIIPQIYAQMNKDTINNISAGDSVSFCIRSNETDSLSSSLFANVIYLKVNDSVILSLEDYNQYSKTITQPLQRELIVRVIILITAGIIIWVILTLKANGKLPKKKANPDNQI